MTPLCGAAPLRSMPSNGEIRRLPLPGAPAARLGCAGDRRARRAGAERLLIRSAAPRRPPRPSRPRRHRPRRRPPARSPACRPPTAAVPQRPAMAVKIDNYPAGRPQSGLDKADIVFEEPVEGGITRYAAVFQCQNVALIGPARSARNIDIGILGQLGTPLAAHVGGINPVLANINASPIVNVDLGASNSLMIHPPGKVSPDADYTSTAIVYGTHPTMTTPPQPLFTYSTTPPRRGTPRSRPCNIHFSGTSNVTWKWNTATNTFQRFYNGTTPDMLANGVQNAAAERRRAVRPDQLRAVGRELRGRPRGAGGPVPQRQRHRRRLPQRDGHQRPPGTAPRSAHRRSSSTPSAGRSRCSRARPGSSSCRHHHRATTTP